MAAILERRERGEDPREEFGPDGFEQAIAEVGAALALPTGRARALIESGYAARYRLACTAIALSQGRIDMRRFEIAMARTQLVDADLMTTVDEWIAVSIADRGHMSLTRFTAMVDTIVARVDPGAIKQRRERASADRGVSIRPDRFTPGQSRISVRLPSADAAGVDARLSSMVAGVCDADPRTPDQRRADAVIALAAGANRLTCWCPDCTAVTDDGDQSAENEHSDEPADAGETDADRTDADQADADQPAADQTAPCSCGGAATAVIHVVANQSTLDGDDNEPGYLDGHGVIDADSIRELAASRFTRIVGVDPATALRAAPDLCGIAPASSYRPSCGPVNCAAFSRAVTARCGPLISITAPRSTTITLNGAVRRCGGISSRSVVFTIGSRHSPGGGISRIRSVASYSSHPPDICSWATLFAEWTCSRRCGQSRRITRRAPKSTTVRPVAATPAVVPKNGEMPPTRRPTSGVGRRAGTVRG